jgi:hypothetical protein
MFVHLDGVRPKKELSAEIAARVLRLIKRREAGGLHRVPS